MQIRSFNDESDSKALYVKADIQTLRKTKNDRFHINGNDRFFTLKNKIVLLLSQGE